MPYGAAIGAAVIAVGATTYSAVEQRNASREANEIQRQQQDLQNKQRQIEMLRQQRLAQASVVANATGSSAGNGLGRTSAGGSGVGGAVSSMTAQGAENIEFANDILQLNRQRMAAIERGESAQVVGQIGRAVGSAVGAAGGSGGTGG